jgi:tRNA(fMet)-specific endonuclease VapC
MLDSYLLDTNLLVPFLNGDANIKAKIRANGVFASSIALGELFYGAYKSGRVDENVKRVETLEDAIIILYCDIQTAKIYGNLKHELQRKGRPIPENDIWIAAIALQHDLILATRDAHFGAVDGLKLEIW